MTMKKGKEWITKETALRFRLPRLAVGKSRNDEKGRIDFVYGLSCSLRSLAITISKAR